MRRSTALCVSCVLLIWQLMCAAAFAESPELALAPFSAEEARRFQREWAHHLGMPVLDTNSIGMKLVLIPPGEFTMGTPERVHKKLLERVKFHLVYLKYEVPAHRVRITRPFYMSATEVTVGQFRQFVEATGYRTEAERGVWKNFRGRRIVPKRIDGRLVWAGTWRDVGYEQPEDQPVVNVSWTDAVAFCRWLSQKEGVHYRLPTEAEWEYACRAGTETLWSFGDRFSRAHAWAAGCGKDRPQPVALKKANPFGLYDMHGNVWEWCADWFAQYYYSRSPMNDPTGPADHELRSDLRIMRGGSYDLHPLMARSAVRLTMAPALVIHHVGFRVVRALNPPPKTAAPLVVDDRKVRRAAENLVKYENNPVLDLGPAGAFDDRNLGCLSVFQKSDGKFYLFYEASREADPHGKPWKLGLATSEDGIHWTRAPANPIEKVVIVDQKTRAKRLDPKPPSRPIYLEAERFHSWYGAEQAGPAGAFLAISYDGVAWEQHRRHQNQPGTTYPAWQDPCIRQIGDRFFMWFTRRYRGSVRIFLSRSDHGRNFLPGMVTENWVETTSEPVLPLGKPGEWDSRHHAHPRVHKIGEVFYMWYLGNDGRRWGGIGLATSRDGVDWRKSPRNPVLTIGPKGSWDSHAIVGLDVLPVGRIFYLWYAAAGAEPQGRVRIRIGLARSAGAIQPGR